MPAFSPLVGPLPGGGDDFAREQRRRQGMLATTQAQAGLDERDRAAEAQARASQPAPAQQQLAAQGQAQAREAANADYEKNRIMFGPRAADLLGLPTLGLRMSDPGLDHGVGFTPSLGGSSGNSGGDASGGGGGGGGHAGGAPRTWADGSRYNAEGYRPDGARKITSTGLPDPEQPQRDLRWAQLQSDVGQARRDHPADWQNPDLPRFATGGSPVPGVPFVAGDPANPLDDGQDSAPPVLPEVFVPADGSRPQVLGAHGPAVYQATKPGTILPNPENVPDGLPADVTRLNNQGLPALPGQATQPGVLALKANPYGKGSAIYPGADAYTVPQGPARPAQVPALGPSPLPRSRPMLPDPLVTSAEHDNRVLAEMRRGAPLPGPLDMQTFDVQDLPNELNPGYISPWFRAHNPVAAAQWERDHGPLGANTMAKRAALAGRFAATAGVVVDQHNKVARDQAKQTAIANRQTARRLAEDGLHKADQAYWESRGMVPDKVAVGGATFKAPAKEVPMPDTELPEGFAHVPRTFTAEGKPATWKVVPTKDKPQPLSPEELQWHAEQGHGLNFDGKLWHVSIPQRGQLETVTSPDGTAIQIYNGKPVDQRDAGTVQTAPWRDGIGPKFVPNSSSQHASKAQPKADTVPHWDRTNRKLVHLPAGYASPDPEIVPLPVAGNGQARAAGAAPSSKLGGLMNFYGH